MSESTPTMRSVTFTELESHCEGSERMWTIINGYVYDVTDWYSLHPGGKFVIGLIAGRDASPHIEMYHSHANHLLVKHAIDKYFVPRADNPNLIGKISLSASECEYTMNRFVEFPNVYQNKFYNDLRAEIHSFLSNKKLNYKGTHVQFYNILDPIVTLSCFLLTLFLSWFHYESVPNGEYFFAFLNGLCLVRIGLLMHMGNHMSYSNNTLNYTIGCLINMIGASRKCWILKHQIMHHVAPNVVGIDSDIGNVLIRQHDLYPKRWFHKFQVLYEAPVMCLLFVSFYVSDVLCFIQYQIVGAMTRAPGETACMSNFQGDLNVNIKPYRNHIMLRPFDNLFEMVGTKVGVMLLAFGPKWLLSDVWNAWGWQQSSGIATVLLAMLTAGLISAIMFAINHLQCGLQNDIDAKKCDYIECNVVNSANWATGSEFWNWASGGLNHQIEHHLFPSMHYTLYPKVAHIVQKHCSKYGLSYKSNNTLKDALAEHVRYMLQMSG